MGKLNDIRNLGRLDIASWLSSRVTRARAAVIPAPEPLLLVRRGDSSERALARASSAFAGS